MSEAERALPGPRAELVDLVTGRWSWQAAAQGADAPAAAARASAGLLASVWSGPAALEATSETLRIGHLAADLTARLAAASRAVDRYVEELAGAQSRVLALRQQWQAGAAAWTRHQLEDGTGLRAPQEAAWQRLRVELLTEHARVIRAVDTAASAASAALYGSLSGLPGADPRGTRAGLLATLPYTDTALRLAAARAAIQELIARTGRPVELWDRHEAWALIELEPRLADPLVARELLQSLSAAQLTRLVTELRMVARRSMDEQSSRQADLALRSLGVAVLVAAEDRVSLPSGAAAAEFQGWRREWVARLAHHVLSDSAGVHGIEDPSVVLSAATIGVLLQLGRAARPELAVGVDFAGTVGPALVAAERTSRTFPRQAYRDIREADVFGEIDPLAALLRAVAGHPQAARTLLLAPVGGPGGQLSVLRYLTVERVSRPEPGTVNRTGEPLVTLLRQVAFGDDEQSARIAGEFLNAFGDVGLAWRQAGGAWPWPDELDPLRQISAELLAEHADAVALMLTRIGADPSVATDVDGRWTINVTSAERLSALVGQLAVAGGSTGYGRADLVDQQGLRPGLTRVLEALILTHSRELAAALATPGRDDEAAAAYRLGLVVGALLRAAAEGLTTYGAAQDQRNATLRGPVLWALEQVDVPALVARAGLIGRVAQVAGALGNLVLSRARGTVEQALPTDHAGRAGASVQQRDADSGDPFEVQMIDLISATLDWPAEQGPAAWAAEHGGATFWGPDGRPLPYAQLTGAGQRAAFLAWARQFPVYTLLGKDVRDGLERGLGGD